MKKVKTQAKEAKKYLQIKYLIRVQCFIKNLLESKLQVDEDFKTLNIVTWTHSLIFNIEKQIDNNAGLKTVE